MTAPSLKKALAPLKPLIGVWRHEGPSAMGDLAVVRTFTPVLSGHWVRLDAVWTYADPKRADYVETCLFGVIGGGLSFSSFINDGSASTGRRVVAEDVGPDALVFEAQMPHGIARQSYRLTDGDTLDWRVERKVKAGWSPIIAQAYRRV